MFEIQKQRVEGQVKVRIGENTKDIKRCYVLEALEKEKLRATSKDDFEYIIMAVLGAKAICVPSEKRHVVEIYYADSNFWRKTPEAIVKGNHSIRNCLKEVFQNYKHYCKKGQS